MQLIIMEVLLIAGIPCASLYKAHYHIILHRINPSFCTQKQSKPVLCMSTLLIHDNTTFVPLPLPYIYSAHQLLLAHTFTYTSLCLSYSFIERTAAPEDLEICLPVLRLVVDPGMYSISYADIVESAII